LVLIRGSLLVHDFPEIEGAFRLSSLAMAFGDKNYFLDGDQEAHGSISCTRGPIDLSIVESDIESCVANFNLTNTIGSRVVQFVG
jgi:hypothetical protein